LAEKLSIYSDKSQNSFFSTATILVTLRDVFYEKYLKKIFRRYSAYLNSFGEVPEMFNKFMAMVLFLIVFPLSGNEQEFVEKLFNQAAVSLTQAKKQCSELPVKNKALIDAMANVHKIAKEKRNPAVNVFAETDYLLGFLQERINDSCSRINLADLESIKIIIATEINELLEKQKSSKNFEQFIDNIFGTEYSKFLYLTATVSTLEKMHTDWGVKMSSDRQNMSKMVSNISAGNKILREELTTFTKSFKLYYEGLTPAVK